MKRSDIFYIILAAAIVLSAVLLPHCMGEMKC